MKKILSVILSTVMIFSLTSMAFAKNQEAIVENKTPVIYLSGDSQKIYYDNGEKSFSIDNFGDMFAESDDANIMSSVFNVLYPFILEGIASDNWDNYYEAVYKEISEAFAPVLLDKDGNAPEGTGLSDAQKADNAAAMLEDRKTKNGTYSEKGYYFHYDWRLDPIEIAEQLNEYIEGVKKATGCDKVSISVKCLGCNAVLAYIAKYSAKSLKGIGFSVATSMGCEFISGAISGKFGVDGNSISRFVTNLSEKDNVYTDIVRPVSAIIDLLDNTGVLDSFTDELREKLYSKIEYGIVSALTLSTLMSYPAYWALVTTEDFDNAMYYVFGAEGSKKREEYKGLIEKITNYNETVKKNVFPILESVKDTGTNICIISKYGTQMIPFIDGGTTYVGDEYVSAYRSSFGATTSDIYTTLSDEYIAQRQSEGLGKYISPDKQIDASTCLFPDSTWFFKGLPHGYYNTSESNIIMKVIDADRQLTVDDFDWTQFIVFDFHTKIASPMTEENCHNEYFEADEKTDHPETGAEKLISLIKTGIRLLKSFWDLIRSRLFKVS